MRSHRDLILWKKIFNLVTAIYAITKSFLKEELYGIVSQIRRAAISIPANISEGGSEIVIKNLSSFYMLHLAVLQN